MKKQSRQSANSRAKFEYEYEPHERLFAFVNELAARLRELTARKISGEPVSEMEQAEFDVLEAMEILRYAELCPIYYKDTAMEEEKRKCDEIELRNLQRLRQLANRMREQDSLPDDEFAEMKLLHEFQLFVRDASGRIGDAICYRNFLPMPTLGLLPMY